MSSVVMALHEEEAPQQTQESEVAPASMDGDAKDAASEQSTMDSSLEDPKSAMDLSIETPKSTASKVSLASEVSQFKKSLVETIRKSAWQNRYPTLLAVLVGGLILGLYYGVPSTWPVFEKVAELERSAGVVFSAIASLVCGGLTPMFVQVLASRALPKPFFAHLLFVVVFWVFLGVYVKGQFALLAVMFGEDAGFATVLQKLAMDQFVISPFINYVWITACFRFRDHSFSCAEFKASYRDRRSVLLQMCGMNVANWATWLPANAVIFSLPSALQMPVWAVIMFFYSGLLTLLSSAAAHSNSPEEKCTGQSVDELATEQTEVCDQPQDLFEV